MKIVTVEEFYDTKTNRVDYQPYKDEIKLFIDSGEDVGLLEYADPTVKDATNYERYRVARRQLGYGVFDDFNIIKRKDKIFIIRDKREIT